MTNILKSFKKAILCEKIAKYNDVHDELGRFAEKGKKSSSKVSTFANLDNYEGMSEETKQKVKKYIDEKVDELFPIDERLGEISKEDIAEHIDSELFNDGYEYGDSDRDLKLIKITVDDLKYDMVSKAVKTYCQEKTGVEDFECYTMDSKLVLDFADGVSWAKEKLGSTTKLSKISSAWDSGYAAKTCITAEGDAHILLMSNAFGEGSTYFDSIDETRHWNPKNADAKQTGAHEFAHAFEYEKTYEIYEKYGYQIRQNAYDLSTVSEAIVTKAAKKINRDLTEIVGEVSEYAKTNFAECFAECIADVYSNGENAAELSKEVFTIATKDIDSICNELDDEIRSQLETRE